MAAASLPSHPRYGPWLCLVLVLSGAARTPAAADAEAQQLFDRGNTWEQFLPAVRAQRDLWLATAAKAQVAPAIATRFRHVSDGLRLLVVAEDWCPDSANVLPYLAALASSASVPLRIVDRTVGEPLMNRHRTSDRRPATPTVVLLRGGSEVAAWVERPAPLQRWFLSMATNPESARRFAERQSWYDSDNGLTVLDEVTALAERTTSRK